MVLVIVKIAQEILIQIIYANFDFNLNPNGYVANMLKNGKNALVTAAEIRKDTTSKKLLKVLAKLTIVLKNVLC